MSADAPTRPLIRRAMTSDLPRLGRLGALLVQAHHELDSQRFLAPNDRTPANYASFLETKLEDPDVAILVAEVHGDVIGYVYAAVQGYDYESLRGPAGVLHDVIVEPQHRGHGVGRLLLNAVLTYLKTRGAPRVVLWAADGNQAAQRLFVSMGFRRTMVEMTRELEEATRVRTP
ncbi:MAG: GNAT family N-acetyltransferase [Verrucomicrobia bacterium]|nr:GNAT family N-acetyltransferase [Verrucomicrobiota bacterium]